MGRSSGKWAIYKDLKEEEKLSSYLLETKLLYHSSLWAMIDKYGQVNIKPVYGAPGEDLINITKVEEDVFEVHTKASSKEIVGRNEVFDCILARLDKQKQHMVQEVVSKGDKKSNPDFMFVRSYNQVKEEWSAMQMLDWMAGDKQKQNECIADYWIYDQLQIISLLATKQLKAKHPDCCCLIFNMALDASGKIRIIDVFMPVRENKWWQYLILSENKEVAVYLPGTRTLWKDTFLEMIGKYNQVMIKPNFGFNGRNIMQVTKVHDDLLELQTEGCKKIFGSCDEVFEYLKKNAGWYIVQQRILLAAIDKCLFDLRVMLQKKEGPNEWVMTGTLARVAYNGYVVTNIAKDILSYEEAFSKSSLLITDSKRLFNELESVCKLAAEQLDKFFNNLQIIGFDIGIDQQGLVWIIEANFTPDLSIFLKLKDKAIYKAILDYKVLSPNGPLQTN